MSIITNQGPVLSENPGEIEKNDMLDKEYNQQCLDAEVVGKTQDMQEGTNELLYGKNIESISREEMILSVKSEYPELVKESFIPLLEGMCYSGELTVEQYDKLLLNYTERGDFHFEGINIPDDIKLSITSKIEVTKSAKDPENEGGIKEFNNDFVELNESINKGDKTPIECELYNLIGRHYIPLSENKDEGSLELNQSTAIEMSCNDLLDSAKNLKTDTIAFNRCIKDIRKGDNIEQKFEGLMSLYTQIGTAEGSVGARGSKNFQLMSLGREKRIDTLKKQYLEIMQSIHTNNDDSNKADLIQEQELIIAEAKEIDNGEVFSTGDIKIEGEKNISDDYKENQQVV